MTEPPLLDQLAAHRMLGAAPRAELEWLAAHGVIRHLRAGEVLSTKGSPLEELHIVLSGSVAITVDRASGPHRIMEWREGDVTGLLPYSRMVAPPGTTIAEVPSTVLAIPLARFPALIQACPEVTAKLVHSMLDRARTFTSSDLHDEKMVSLGKLSAGLAHELNNPASAIERSAGLLLRRLDDAQQAARALGAAGLSDAQFTVVDAVREACLAVPVRGVRSPLEQAAHEEALHDWLTGRGLDARSSDALAESAVTFEDLESLARTVHGPALDAALRWVASGCAVRRLATEILDAAVRISGLVVAIKGFTHMDQATVAEPVDLIRSLGDTVVVLRSKARARSAAVVVDTEPGLPRVRGFIGELNQIWANLIDNALDAIPDGGRVEVRAVREQRHVVVRVIDNGPGIPPAVRDRIFDPFFTTKPVGLGTGLGLDIVRRLVRHNEGEIHMESAPGRTEFRVVLPVADGVRDGDPA